MTRTANICVPWKDPGKTTLPVLPSFFSAVIDEKSRGRSRTKANRSLDGHPKELGSEFLSYGRGRRDRNLGRGEASLVFRDEVLIEAKLKGNRTSKSFFAVFSDRLIMVVVADTIDYFLGAITRRL
jgi:hypothetical protein